MNDLLELSQSFVNCRAEINRHERVWTVESPAVLSYAAFEVGSATT